MSKSDHTSIERARQVVSFLRKKNIPFSLQISLAIPGPKTRIEKSNAPIVIAVGDDNFLLTTIREMGKDQKPILGIASAQSFLAQTNAHTFQESLTLLHKNKFSILKRARIVASMNGHQTYTALNDIGIFSSKSASLIRYTLSLNTEALWSDSADGIIVSTPTGSTGYSYSAYGPIIINEPEILSITPVTSIEKKSAIIVSNQTSIRISDVQGHAPIVIMDGDVRAPLKHDTVSIQKSENDALFVRFAKEFKLESKLKKRMASFSSQKVKNLPPSAKLVYSILSYEGNLTQKELISATSLPERTVRHALDVLLEKQLITKRPYLSDARQTVYEV